MTTVISVHSFRGGTGKSNTTSNLAAQLAAAGNRVAVVDTDIQSPGIHVLFGFADDLDHTLNDYLWGKLPIKDTAHDVTSVIAQNTITLAASDVGKTIRAVVIATTASGAASATSAPSPVIAVKNSATTMPMMARPMPSRKPVIM